MAKRVLSVRVDEDLVDAVDGRRGDGATRADVVEEALRAWLAPVEVRPAPQVPAVLRPVSERLRQAGVKTASELMMERQVRLNKQMGWSEK